METPFLICPITQPHEPLEIDQYINIDHLEVYTIKELSIIADLSPNVGVSTRAKKDYYIKLIRGNVAFMTKQRAINRDLILDFIN